MEQSQALSLQVFFFFPSQVQFASPIQTIYKYDYSGELM